MSSKIFSLWSAKGWKHKDHDFICSINQLYLGPNKKLYTILYRWYNTGVTFVHENQRLKQLKIGMSSWIMLEICSLSWPFCHTYIDESASNFNNMLANLDKRKKNEKLAIIESLKGQYELSSEV